MVDKLVVTRYIDSVNIATYSNNTTSITCSQ